MPSQPETLRIRSKRIAAALLLAITANAPARPQHEPSNAPPAPPVTAAADAAPTPAKDLAWIRTRTDQNRVLRLQLAIREFKPKNGIGPTIVLAGAVHIADRAFYKQLESTLESENDLILYESVKPGGLGESVIPDGIEGDPRRSQRTTDRIRLAWAVLERWKRSPESGGEYPASIAELRRLLVDAGHGREEQWLRTVGADAWGRDLLYERAPDGQSITLGSLGKDGERGGDGPDRDTWLSDLPPLKPQELGEGAGIQKRLAETLGLAFQLDEMKHSGPKWVNSDMSIDDVSERLGPPADGDDSQQNLLFALLDGSSFPARVASALLTIVESVPGMAVRMKVMMLEMLANADDGMLDNLKGPGFADMSRLMKVIIDDRNQVVIDDLRKTILERPETGRIAVLYGAGHLPDLARRLEEKLGYVHSSGKWITAVRVDLDRAGIDESEIAMTREMMRAQLNAMKRLPQEPVKNE